ncbi:MAG: hypothetical protein ACD_51C00028G0027 [uncultured bacterium]|nr:MAG: hypothetical protein ACD_51C00028G0027 [uncultured bacterium]OGJ47891.1 MAG: hypothetical protein A2244_05430 [Candidatus Peregrinibacteria bacterium RIFOXYA2_FULL_41_18]OGJ49131.1 MAG: hypothetical protein A2344_00985 [Candidatus Peregrinibacteria bacterium RIFOXYB12_FULL_41_12]
MFEYISSQIVYSMMGLQTGSRETEVIYFFIYDSIKILTLVFAVVTVIAFIRTFFAPGKTKAFMAKAKYGSGNLIASMFGAVTPFCSCSSIPIFIGFIKAGVPAGVAFSFLITSPLVNEVAFVIMGGMFGWRLATLYAVSGIVLGVVCGILIDLIGVEKEIILERGPKIMQPDFLPKTFDAKSKYAVKEGWTTLKKLFPYILAGVMMGALIHGYVPQEFFMKYVGKYEMLSVPIAVLIGVPIYAGCSMLVPIIFSITANGVPLGTSLAFMMAIAGLSLPEAVMLKRVLSIKLIGIFFGMVAAGIVIIGYLFNFLS